MNFNESTPPYTFVVTFASGKQFSVTTVLSLSMATRFAEEQIRKNMDGIEAIEIVDNYTGEIVYSVKANIRIDFTLEIYNPYNA